MTDPVKEQKGWDKMRRSKEEQHFEEENKRLLAKLSQKSQAPVEPSSAKEPKRSILARLFRLISQGR